MTSQVLSGTIVHQTVVRRHKSGVLVEVEGFGVPFVVDGVLRGQFALYQDISDRLKAQRALRQSEEMFRTLTAAAPVGIFRSDANGHVTYPLVLLDVNMPGINGYEVAAKLRQIVPAEETAIIVLSSSLTQPSHIPPEQLQIGRKLTKPIRRAELHEAITLLLGSASKRGKPASQYEPTATTNLRLLLVEDNTVNQRPAIRLLEKMGHQVQLAVNGREAVELSESVDFDLILMDLQMPVMGGLQATQKIREREATLDKHTPVLAMTAHAMKGYQEKCLEAGMDGYITKPIRTELLKHEIARLTVRARTENSMNTTRRNADTDVNASAVNLPELLGRVENDWDLLRELAAIFREEYPRYTKALRLAIREGNLEQAREAAHALKGMLANLAAGRAAEAAGQLEQFANSGQQGALASSFAKFETDTKGLLAELEGYMAGAEK